MIHLIWSPLEAPDEGGDHIIRGDIDKCTPDSIGMTSSTGVDPFHLEANILLFTSYVKER